MTYDEVLYDLKEDLNINSDDRSFDVPDAYLLNEYSTNRAYIITQTYNKGTVTLDADLTQRLVVPMGPVDKGLCGIITGCLINRSIDPLPSKPIHLKDGPMLEAGTPVINGKRVKTITEGKSNNVGNSPFTKGTYFMFYSGDGHIYLISKLPSVLGIKNLAVYGVFEDPEKVSEANTCVDFDCSQYPVKKAMHKTVHEMVLQHMQIKLGVPADEVNDASGQIKQGVAPAKR